MTDAASMSVREFKDILVWCSYFRWSRTGWRQGGIE